MCGIFGVFNYEHIEYEKSVNEFISKIFNSAAHRGPDNSVLVNDSISHSFLGFHRLTINGSNHYYNSNQPIYKNDIILLCNGEIYNYHTLLNELDLTLYEKQKHSGSDCEIIIDLYLKYGIDTTVELLDGPFAFILLDMRCLSDDTIKTPKLFVARDPFGLRPLYWLKPNQHFFDGDFPELVGSCLPFGFASEMKQLAPLIQETTSKFLTVEPVQPGHYICYSGSILTHTHNYLQEDAKTFQKKLAWIIQPSSIECVKYFTFPHFRQLNHINHIESVCKIKDYLINAVNKRIQCTDRPIACLLSGGIDSSLICGIIRSLLPNDKPLETYSIGMVGASDKEYIKTVAEYIKSTHTHVELSKEAFLSAIPDVIRLLETHDTTTVRASVGNYLIAKYISEHSDAKVIFNGDGSDELFGGYKYFLNCPNKYEFNKERKRLLTDLHYFDVLRSERSISVNKLEARTPFLDKELVSYVMTLCHDLTFTFDNESSNETYAKRSTHYQKHQACVFESMKQSGIEKWMLRRAFIDSNLIPLSILTRSKEAFSDGVSSQEDSWYIIIQKQIISMIHDNAFEMNIDNGKKLYIEKNVFLKLVYETNKTSVCTLIDYDDLLDISELYDDDAYRKIKECYKSCFVLTNNDALKTIMLNTEKWYYRKIYDYYYYPVNTIPYYWMPKYSTETNDPSARTLTIYNNTADNTLSPADMENSIRDKILLKNVNAYNIPGAYC
jgi:asparagine synthase (glutamine-hydrolysing)